MLAAADVDGVVLCSSDINPALLDVLIRGEQARDRDLYLDPGLSGIDFRRVQALPIAHQPLLYVEAPSLSRLQVGFKRAFDIVVSPSCCSCWRRCCSAIAVAIKLEDGGPVLFRQRRVGRDGVEFEILKFRTMCVDAEARLAALRAGTTSAPARCSSWTARPAGHARSAGSSGRPASTSCRSCSTCCAAR